VCPYQPKLKRRPDEPPPELRNAAIQVEMDEVSHCVKTGVKLFYLSLRESSLTLFFTTPPFCNPFQFMTLRRLNLKIQGFPESYATEPYAGENMVVGEPRRSPASMSPDTISRGRMSPGGDDPNQRPQPELHDSSMGVRGSPPMPSSASPLRSPPTMPNGSSPRGSPPRIHAMASPRGSPASVHSGADPRGSPRSVHSGASNRRSPPAVQGAGMSPHSGNPAASHNGSSPRGSPPMLNGQPMPNGLSPRGSPQPMLNGLSPRGSPLPMQNRSSPRGSPRGSPPLAHDASTGTDDAPKADSVTKV
jgi:hypothetical protein